MQGSKGFSSHENLSGAYREHTTFQTKFPGPASYRIQNTTGWLTKTVGRISSLGRIPAGSVKRISSRTILPIRLVDSRANAARLVAWGRFAS